jgi:hypothetical protein
MVVKIIKKEKKSGLIILDEGIYANSIQSIGSCCPITFMPYKW